MTTTKDIKKEFVKKINDEYFRDLLDIEKCRSLKEKYANEIKRLRHELTVGNENSTVTDYVTKIDNAVSKIDYLLNQVKIVSDEITENLEETEEVQSKVQSYMHKLNTLQCSLQYIKVIQRIESLSTDLQKEIANQDDEQCATIFANLCEVNRHLADSPAFHLRNHLKETLLHWHGILKQKFSNDFDGVLKIIKWPFVNTNFSLQVPSQASIQKIQLIVEYLLQIELPEEISIPQRTSAILSDFPSVSLPIQLLIQPLRKRFLYHFYGTRQTNRVDKPEWYFTQILSWIRDHSEFVEKWVQPVAEKMGLHHIDAKVELMQGLVQLAVEKLYSDLPNLQYDDFTFSHCVDEALGFDKELRESYDFPQSPASVLVVLTQAQVFVKWMAMERKYAVEKMDVMLSQSALDAFQPLASDIDDLKITTCADTFITLLQTITERYEALPQPGHRLQFLELQLELLDDFRVRLLQLVNAEEGKVVESKVPAIANTVFYIENVLIDWGAMLHYLNLYYYKSQLENVDVKDPSKQEFDESPVSDIETDTVFADTLSLYHHMRKDLVCMLAESIVLEAKAKSRNYRHETWSGMTAHKDIRSLSLTPSACPIFEVLATRLHQLKKSLANKLFTIVWRSIAQQLDTYLYEELVLENRFNDGGALQFKFDVTRNLFPLFSQFSDKPEVYFTQLNESCALLNITKGSALLLRETLLALEGATGVEDRRGQALKEIGVVNFTPKASIAILNKRTDITINRMSSID